MSYSKDIKVLHDDIVSVSSMSNTLKSIDGSRVKLEVYDSGDETSIVTFLTIAQVTKLVEALTQASFGGGSNGAK